MKIYSLLLTLSLLCLAGCGFHLRGHQPLPVQLQVIYVQSNDPYGLLTKQLEQTLRSVGVIIATNANTAPVTLQILDSSFNQILTGQGVSGQLSTYLLTYRLSFQLLNVSGGVIQPPLTVTTSRNYSISANQILGDTSVKNNLQEDMSRDLINQLFAHLRAKSTLRNLHNSIPANMPSLSR